MPVQADVAAASRVKVVTTDRPTIRLRAAPQPSHNGEHMLRVLRVQIPEQLLHRLVTRGAIRGRQVPRRGIRGAGEEQFSRQVPGIPFDIHTLTVFDSRRLHCPTACNAS